MGLFRNMDVNQKTNGFTLLQLLLVIALTGVMATAAYPYYQDLMARQAFKQQAQSLHQQFLLARNHAVQYKAFVRVCALDANNHCITSLPLEQPFSTFIDANNNARLDPDERLISQMAVLPSQLVMTSNQASYLYRPDGRSSVLGTVRLESNTTQPLLKAELLVGMTGRPRICFDASC